MIKKLLLNKKDFGKYISNINDADKFASYSQETNEYIFSRTIEQLIDSQENIFYWNNPSEQFSFIALGEILSFDNKNKNNSNKTSILLFKDKKNHYHNINKTNFNKVPLILGTKKFPLREKTSLWSDYDDNKWFIPKYLILRNKNNFSFIINFLGNDSDIDNYLNDFERIINNPSSTVSAKLSSGKVIKNYADDTQNWNEMIFACLEKISKKELEKVVAARRVSMEVDVDICLSDIISSLENNYPQCRTFIYRKDGSAFFGATPEKLFSVSGGIIETEALAGSIQRGDSPLSDNELGTLLLESEKDINEHNSVRNFLLEKLYPLTEEITYEPVPQLRKLSNIQHLCTPIAARLKKDTDFFSLIDTIFPTPAICGYPTESALKLIGSMESFDRGLYAGLIGWFNFNNEGEFAVALRSALLKDNIVHAFAGCGIVEGSDPLSEYEETELKLKPIISLFIDETINQS
jgi:menaquinone-specific isochorismate synthase